jgi:uncharacterized protein (TIGR02145 family)
MQLTDYLGEGAATKMKSTSGWKEDGNGTNESRFNGLPGGYRYDDGYSNYVGINGYWWSSSQKVASSAWDRYLNYKARDVYRASKAKEVGFSVRCIKD